MIRHFSAAVQTKGITIKANWWSKSWRKGQEKGILCGSPFICNNQPNLHHHISFDLSPSWWWHHIFLTCTPATYLCLTNVYKGPKGPYQCIQVNLAHYLSLHSWYLLNTDDMWSTYVLHPLLWKGTKKGKERDHKGPTFSKIFSYLPPCVCVCACARACVCMSERDYFGLKSSCNLS